MEKKYELVREIEKVIEGHTLYRIRAVKDFNTTIKVVRKGDLGGFVESEKNLSHDGCCWIFDDACAIEDSTVKDDAIIRENAIVSMGASVYGSAFIKGYAKVDGGAEVFDHATMTDHSSIHNNGKLFESAIASENSFICGNAKVHGFATLIGSANISGNANIRASSDTTIESVIRDNAIIDSPIEFLNLPSKTKICGNALIRSIKDVAFVGGFGSDRIVSTFFRCSDGEIRVSSGYFFGTIKEFRDEINSMEKGINKIDYLAIVDLMEIHFKMNKGNE